MVLNDEIQNIEDRKLEDKVNVIYDYIRYMTESINFWGSSKGGTISEMARQHPFTDAGMVDGGGSMTLKGRGTTHLLIATSGGSTARQSLAIACLNASGSTYSRFDSASGITYTASGNELEIGCTSATRIWLCVLHGVQPQIIIS